ncbi:MAG: pyridoxal-phosphate-dependent aminotransferase family protein [Candidatus Binatia bacterium]
MISPLKLPQRILLGPGPSNVHSAVLKALSAPVVGHLDPEFFNIMEENKEMLRWLFQTKNELTFPVSGTGSAGMETCLVNLIEEGDPVLVGINGVFGTRMADVVERCGGKLIRVEAPWGEIIRPEQIARVLKQNPVKIVSLVHAETSTGIWQPVEEISRMVHDAGALLVLDTVTSLGGCPVTLDTWHVDACYSGTQKCLSCPPGLSPASFNDAARKKFENRKKKVKSWYLDVTMIERYWGKERVYHHTAPVSMNYGLHEALRLVKEEGLKVRFRRHELNHKALAAGLQALGIQLASQGGHRLWMLNSVAIPEGAKDSEVRKRLLQEFSIEIGSGLGSLAGKTWRIGLMGESSRKEYVIKLLRALGDILPDYGLKASAKEAVAAAEETYRLNQ